MLAMLFAAGVFAQGMEFDQDLFQQRTEYKLTRAQLPASYSLMKYTPMIYPQIGSTCVGHSFANARTILLAKQLGITSKEDITSLLFSPYFVYYRNKSASETKCATGLNMENAAMDFKNNGIPLLVDVEYPEYYPFTSVTICNDKGSNYYPPTFDSDKENAKKFAPTEIYRIESLDQLREALYIGMPVVIGMAVPPSFGKCTSDLWEPVATDNLDNASGHAMVIVAYDDAKYGGAVQLMNSWGTDWGNQGYVWVSYDQIPNWVYGGYGIYVDETTTNYSAEKPEMSSTSETQPQAEIVEVYGELTETTFEFDNAEFIKCFIEE